jgi:hypothetical protein
VTNGWRVGTLAVAGRAGLAAEVAVTVMRAGIPRAISAARPRLIRALGGQLLLGHIPDHAPCSPADLARLCGLRKPTMSLALTTVKQAGLIREAGKDFPNEN